MLHTRSRRTMISEVHIFSSFSWMIGTIVITNPGVLVISLRISPPSITCFNVEETETGIEESLTQLVLIIAKIPMLLLIMNYKCKISWCSYLNISLMLKDLSKD